MNPPFGETSVSSKLYCDRTFGDAAKDLYVTFIARVTELLHPGGRVGAISSRTGFFLSSFKRFREEILFKSLLPVVVADLGAGVLDAATVETAAYCLERDREPELPAAFLQVLNEEDKESKMLKLVTCLSNGVFAEGLFLVRPRQFLDIPGAPLCYWISDRIRNWFIKLKPLCDHGWYACVTNPAGDDTRYFRAGWEVAHATVGREVGWVPLMKGGSFSPFYSDLHLLVAWDAERESYKGFLGTEHRPLEKPASVDRFFKPGLTWPRRTNGLSFRVLPAEAIFADKGPAIFPKGSGHSGLLALCGVLNSVSFLGLVSLQLGRVALAQSFEVGLIKQTPLPAIPSNFEAELNALSLKCIRLLQEEDRFEETNHLYLRGWLAQPEMARIEIAAHAFKEGSDGKHSELQSTVERVDDLCFDLYGASKSDRTYLEDSCRAANLRLSAKRDTTSANDLTKGLFSYLLGCVFGRWDIRYATGERPAPELPDPFAPLPVCPPGMLQGDDGLPLGKKEGRRMRDEGNYPLDVAWDGILVDDSEHPLDVERRVHAVLALLWTDRADALEHEACVLLGVPSLREWFRRPAGFFADHLKRYSKSRRQAPIYWPLSTASGSYTLWLYYHRLNDQTLYTCVTDFVKPKLDSVTADADRLQAKTQTGGTAKERSELQELRDFQAELQELADELLRVAQLPWKPDLNDGVLITASPLWKVFRLPKWQKDLKACWEELAAGDYDWAHLALTIWPDRVRKNCKTNRSFAIAHGLEDLCDVAAPKPKAKRKKKKEETSLV